MPMQVSERKCAGTEAGQTGRQSNRGPLVIAGCRAAHHLVNSLAEHCREAMVAGGLPGHLVHLSDIDHRFANSETCVRLDASVEGADVYVVQALCAPDSGGSVDDNYVGLLSAGRAAREYGASHVTAVIPYLAYGRQDKPTEGMREPVTAKLMADLTVAAGFDRVMSWHPHCGQLRGFYGGLPVHFLDPVPYFVSTFEGFAGKEDVIVVAPDAGAAKLAAKVADRLDLRFAVGAKDRPSRDTVEMGRLAGDFRGVRTALVVEDEMGTGATAFALVRKLYEDEGISSIHFSVSHNRCVEGALDRLKELRERYGLVELSVTDSIPQTDPFRSLPFLRESSLAGPLSEAIAQVHTGAGSCRGSTLPLN